MTVTLADLLKDSAYRLDQFKPEHISALEAGITLKEAGEAAAPYVTCLARGKPIKLTPEEAVRQLYLRVLHLDMGYSYCVNKIKALCELLQARGEP